MAAWYVQYTQDNHLGKVCLLGVVNMSRFQLPPIIVLDDPGLEAGDNVGGDGGNAMVAMVTMLVAMVVMV